jgi:hypothetical protein
MMKYLPRHAEAFIEWALRQFPVVVLTGARQTGKTTLAQRLPSARGRLFRTLDDPVSLEMAARDPQALLSEAPRLTLDEVQRRPEILLYVKRAVDARRRPGQFLLTGSANLLLMAGVSESLAGRATYLTLRPMTEPEKSGSPGLGPWDALLSARSAADAVRALDVRPPTRWSWARAALEGGFPVAVRLRSARARRAWLDGYVQTYVERDLRQLAQIDALLDFRRLLKISALRVGRLANQAQMARDAGLSHATAHRYLNLLETSFLVARVSPYSVSRTKRLMKTPKLYLGDVGLAAHLAGIGDGRELRARELSGGLLENIVWHHLQCWADLSENPANVLFWRTAAGEEVDFVVETRGRLLPIEVKSTTTLRPDDLRHLHAFLDEYRDSCRVGVVLYGGEECRVLAPRVAAVPLSTALAARARPSVAPSARG